MSKPFKTICVAFFLMAWQLAGAEAVTNTKEGDKISGVVTFNEKNLFSNKKKADIPLPPGEWTVRLVEKVKSNHSDPVNGVMLALDKVENNLVIESLNISAYDQNQRLWNVTCEPGISHQPNLGNYDSECFTLDLKTFMTDSSSDWQLKLKKKWNDAGISWGGNALNASIYIISPTFGHVAVYYSIPTGRFLDDSKTARESPLHSSKLNNADEKIKSLLPAVKEWYQDYFKRVKEGVYKAKDNLPPSRLSAGMRSVVPDIEKLAAKTTGVTNAVAVAVVSPKPKISTPANLLDLSIDDDLSDERAKGPKTIDKDVGQLANEISKEAEKELEQLRLLLAEKEKAAHLAEETRTKEREKVKQRVLEAERKKPEDSGVSISQSVESSFPNNKSPQNLKFVTKSDIFDAYLDQNRKIINADGSITIETILEYNTTQSDGTKSLVSTYTYYCNEMDEKKYSRLEFYNYSSSKKTGAILKAGKATPSKVSIKTGSVSEMYFYAACALPQKSFKMVSKLRPEEINLSIIKDGMTETDLDVFLTMYSFIWIMNNYLSYTPDELAEWYHYDSVQRQKAIQEQQRLVPYKNSVQNTLNRFEETISSLAANVGLTNAQFKEAVGIIEVFVPPDCDRCAPGYRALKTKTGTGKIEDLTRRDITSKGINTGAGAVWKYISAPGLASIKNDKGHPGVELTPPAFFDFYSKWISDYFLASARLGRLRAAAVSVEARLEKEYLDAEQAKAKRQEEERARQEFLKSPEGQRQIAKEQEEARQRQKQFADQYPFYAVITCGEYFPVHACFSGRIKTELELTNGNDYRMYQLIDIMQIPQDQAGISFNLRDKFKLQMQNSSGDLLLNLKIYDRVTNQIVFQKSASQFGLISFSSNGIANASKTNASPYNVENLGSCAAFHQIMGALARREGDAEAAKFHEEWVLQLKNKATSDREYVGIYYQNFNKSFKIMADARQAQASRGVVNSDWGNDFARICVSIGIPYFAPVRN